MSKRSTPAAFSNFLTEGLEEANRLDDKPAVARIAPAAAPLLLPSAPAESAPVEPSPPSVEPAAAPHEEGRVEESPPPPPEDRPKSIRSSQPKREVTKKPPPAQAAAKRTQWYGTIENEYVRKRDDTPTRKRGFVLPIDLITEIEAFCLYPKRSANVVAEEAFRMYLDKQKKRGASK